AELALVLGERVKRLHAVDDDDPGPALPEEAVDGPEHPAEPVLDERLAQVVIDDAPVGDGGPVEKIKTLPVPEDLVERLRDGREVERGVFGGGVVKRVLLAEDRLPAAGDADDHVDRVDGQAPAQDLVDPGVAAG